MRPAARQSQQPPDPARVQETEIPIFADVMPSMATMLGPEKSQLLTAFMPIVKQFASSQVTPTACHGIRVCECCTQLRRCASSDPRPCC